MDLAPEIKEKFKANAERVTRLLKDENGQANTEIVSSEYIWAKATAIAMRNLPQC